MRTRWIAALLSAFLYGTAQAQPVPIRPYPVLEVTDPSSCLTASGGIDHQLCRQIGGANDGDLYVCTTSTCSGAGWVAVGGGGAANVSVNGSSASDPDFRSEGDLSAVLCTGAGAPDAACLAAGDVLYNVKANSVALGTDTTGNYAGSSSEGGAATTATALSANPANCVTPGEFPVGVDASGVAEGCATPAGGPFALNVQDSRSGITATTPNIDFEAGPQNRCSGDDLTPCQGDLECSLAALGTCEPIDTSANPNSTFLMDWKSGGLINEPDVDCAGYADICVCSNDSTLDCTDATEVAVCGGANRCVRGSWEANDFLFQMRWNDENNDGTFDNPNQHFLAESWEYDYAAPNQSDGRSLIEKHFIAVPPGGCPSGWNCRWETRLLDIDNTPPTMQIWWTGRLDDYGNPRLLTVTPQGNANVGTTGDPIASAVGASAYNHPVTQSAGIEGRFHASVHDTNSHSALLGSAWINTANYRGVCDGTGGSTLGAICTTDAQCNAGAGNCEKTDNLCVSGGGVPVVHSITPGCSAQIPEIQSTCAASQFCVANARYTGINSGTITGNKSSLIVDEPTTNPQGIGYCSNDEATLCVGSDDCGGAACTKVNDGIFNVGSYAHENSLRVETDGSNLPASWRANAVSAPTGYDSFHFSQMGLVRNVADFNGSGGGQGTGIKLLGFFGDRWEAVQKATSQVCDGCGFKSVADWGILGENGTNNLDGFLMYDELDQTNPAANSSGGTIMSGHGLIYALRHGMQWDDPHLRLGGAGAVAQGDHLFWDETDEVLRVKIDAAGEGANVFGPRARNDGFSFVRGTGYNNRACTGSGVPYSGCTGAGTGSGLDVSASDDGPYGPNVWARDGTSCIDACRATSGLECAGDDDQGAAGVGGYELDATPEEVGCEVTTNRRICMCE